MWNKGKRRFYKTRQEIGYEIIKTAPAEKLVEISNYLLCAGIGETGETVDFTLESNIFELVTQILFLSWLF
ncbi:hypothetical protein [Adhaeribacter rhizoryzae]|uniref:Uncharacterized protein n=1 Tax=Adhaeribacter rhizoryzae TaxID=2607907 RepID=A0A5M6DBS0_9BACT|nr:hypothetical protein [Adhaeribacter rhizoryzae]KAA5543936.1 hypothetical protein F0145_15240 [Adhaeribacter rhizoryzae]